MLRACCRGLICLASILGFTTASLACPFCTALEPSLGQLRESATTVLLAEVKSTGEHPEFTLHKVLKPAGGPAPEGELTLTLDPSVKPGTLLLLFGTGQDPQRPGQLSWKAVNETSYAYFARAPSRRQPSAKRLAYFVSYLEHAEPLVADDAYLEFGHAPFGEVEAIAAKLPMEKLRHWMEDARVPDARKAFYAMALGLAASDADRTANVRLLERLITAPGDDFRTGFDGLLAGYLMLEGDRGLAVIERRYLADPKARHGDVRHALTALRFCYEYCPGVDKPKLVRAARWLLKRSDFADQVVVDLARWQDWDCVEQVHALYSPEASVAMRRSVVGYLTTCPTPAARQALAQIRKSDPAGAKAAEDSLSGALQLSK